MPRELTGLRVARSILTPEGTETLTTEIDFQLGAQIGIAIHGVYGSITGFNSSLAAQDDSSQNRTIEQTLHLETGLVEDPLDSAADDAFDIDTEIFYRQDLSMLHIWNSVAGDGAGITLSLTPSSTVWFPRPINSARNITHRANATVGDVDGVANILVYFVYVEFSLSEMGLFLARRQ